MIILIYDSEKRATVITFTYDLLSFLEAGECFCLAAKVQLNQIQCKHEAATLYVEGANCFRKSDHEGNDFYQSFKVLFSLSPYNK